MSIISQETWDNMPQEEKEKIISDYQEYARFCEEGVDKFDRNDNLSRKRELERLFGKGNLQPEPKIKTWEDIEKLLPEDGFCVGNFEKFADEPKVILKCQATLKIAKLIELGYGGIVTEEEWKDHATFKYCIEREDNELTYTHRRAIYVFIAFHTPKQREEFMSYPENRELVKQYHMI